MAGAAKSKQLHHTFMIKVDCHGTSHTHSRMVFVMNDKHRKSGSHVVDVHRRLQAPHDATACCVIFQYMITLICGRLDRTCCLDLVTLHKRWLKPWTSHYGHYIQHWHLYEVQTRCSQDHAISDNLSFPYSNYPPYHVPLPPSFYLSTYIVC